ncbi:hypothetical protein BBJ28_00012532 [Nothophytophthora sp. Chile5]|nr:hypothetical protein BBJ28_00012532 [Nothophytophthora sp. Chile5]
MSHCYPPNTTHAPGPSAQSSTKGDPFQMPSYTFHTSRGSPGRTRSEHCAPDSGLSPSKMRGRPDRKRPPTVQKDSDQSLLEMLTSTVACLKQKNMDLEALGCLEQSLWLKRRMFGVDNSVVHRALNEVMLSYNSVAMQYLSQGQFDQCLAMLRKAEAITAPGNFKKCQALQILTFNNIGCCYRKLSKLKSALKYLKEAAQLGSSSAHVKNLSITHLNLCAIQSQLGRHDLALEHAQAAIFHTQEELVSLEDRAGDDREEEAAESESGEQAGLMDALDAKTREEKIISLAVAYHNLAVELEFNGRGEASLQWYKKALQLVWKYRETNEALCESFKKIFLDARKKQQTANVRQNGIPSFTSTPANGSARRRNPTVVESQRRQQLQGQLYFAGRDDDLMGNDEDYGVAVDDGDSDDDDLDAFSAALQSDRSNNQSEGKGDSSVHNRPRDGKTLRAGAAGSKRHRKVLDDARVQTPRGQSEAGQDSDSGVSSSPRPEESSPSSCQTGYSGDDDADMDVDLPTQRVSHMEYLRRMKKLAESIKDDLNGVNAPPKSTKPAQFAASQARNSPQRSAETNEAADACSPKLTIPRSATCKVRNRLEQVRLDSLGNLQQTEQDGDTAEQLSPTATAAKSRDEADDGGIEIQEDANVFGSRDDVCAGERRLFHAAAGRRLQAFFRGQRCRVELVTEQAFLEELSAVKIQAVARGRQSRLLTECVGAGRHTAASVIQRSFRINCQSTQRSVDTGVRSIAARTIQEVFRACAARKAVVHQAVVQEELCGAQQIAAATIQNFWRQSAADRDHRLEELEAALCIQALGRGHLTRKSLQSLRSSSSQGGFSKHVRCSWLAPSGFSASSFAEKVMEEEHPESEHKDQTLGINYSFLPSSIRALCLSSDRQEHPERAVGQRHAKDIAELGLTFSDFLREFETCADAVLGSSALDAMRILLVTSPESTKTR